MVNNDELAVIKQSLQDAIKLIIDKQYIDFTEKYLSKEYIAAGGDFFVWLKDYCIRDSSERFVTMPPDTAFERENMHIMYFTFSDHYYCVDFDLWIDGEQSDITLQCTFDFRETEPKITYDDLHVL